MMDITSWPNPKDHPDNASLPNINRPETLIGTTIAFLSIALFAISLRLWVRIRDRLWGWDDAFVFLAGVASFSGDIIVCQMPGDGLGLHLWTLDQQHMMKYYRHIYSSNVAYCASSTFIKLSILFQYLRLFAETAPPTSTAKYCLARRITIVLITLTSAWGLTFFSLAVFSCNPIAKNWNPFLRGTCVGWGTKDPAKFFAMFVGHSASNMLLDILVLLLPVPFLSMMNLVGKSRAGLITLFTLGSIIAAVAIGRMISLSINRAGTIPIPDMSYHTPIVFIFAVLEVNIAIIAASIPIFWPVIATLAMNKIWVVNEIEIHVEDTTRDSFSSSGAIGLVEQGGWKDDAKEDLGGRTSRLSVVSKVYDRTNSRQSKQHRHKHSNSSSIGRTLGLDLGTRVSQDSQRELYRAPSHELVISPVSLTRSERDDWFAEIDKLNTCGRITTKVEKTEIPFAQIKAFDK